MNRVDLLLALVVLFHIWACPYTKVEESFNLQAAHDFLYHGGNITEVIENQTTLPNIQYDHLQFPGVVPRSFSGAFALSVLSKPLQYLTATLGWSKFASQLLGKHYYITTHQWKSEEY